MLGMTSVLVEFSGMQVTWPRTRIKNPHWPPLCSLQKPSRTERRPCKDLVTNGFPLIGRQRFQTLLEQVPLGSRQLRNSCQPVTTHRTPATTEPVGSRLADSQHTSINIGMKLCQWV
jgi:hypothetical protein